MYAYCPAAISNASKAATSVPQSAHRSLDRRTALVSKAPSAVASCRPDEKFPYCPPTGSAKPPGRHLHGNSPFLWCTLKGYCTALRVRLDLPCSRSRALMRSAEGVLRDTNL